MLSARVLNNVANVNEFVYTNELVISEGDPATLYFQLYDPSQVLATMQGINLLGTLGGLRYIPVTGATATVTFLNIDNAKQFTRSATNPFPGDMSIFSVPILASDPLTGSVNLKILLREGASIRTIFLNCVISVQSGAGTC